MKIKSLFSMFLVLVLVSFGVYFVVAGSSFTTPANNVTLVGGNYSINVSTDQIVSVTNVRFYNISEGGGENLTRDEEILANVTNLTSGGNTIAGFILNTYNLMDGGYNITAVFLNASRSGNVTINTTIIVDNTAPSTIDLLFPINSTELIDNTIIVFNFTVIDAIDVTLNCNLTVDGIVINSTITGADISDSRVPVVVSSTVIDQGLHYWNMTCWDDAIDLNGIKWNLNDTSRPNRTAGIPETLSVGANFTLTDNTAPTTAAPTFSASSVVKGTSITIACVGTDGITSNPTEHVSIKNPNSADWQENLGISPYTYTGTSDVGTYTVKCYSNDTAGNGGTSDYGSEATFIVTRSVSSTGTSTSGTSSTGTKTVTVLTGQTRDLGSIVGGEGVINAYRASTATFTVVTSSETTASLHSITFDDVNYIDGQITITIMSDPIVLVMDVGDTKTVDMDDDGVDDLEVTLNSIDSNGKVNMNIRDLVGEATAGGGEEGTTGGEEETTGEISEGGMSWIWWLVIVIVIVAIIALVLPKKRK